MPDKAIRIEGLRELERAFRLYGRGLEKGLREAMEAGAEVVRPDAETLALSEIRRMTLPWSRMRVGVSRRVAYVAPVERGRNTKRGRIAKDRYSRPNLKPLLLDRALEPALEQNVPRVEREFSDALDDLARRWSRV
jgi:hypothetical protein